MNILFKKPLFLFKRPKNLLILFSFLYILLLPHTGFVQDLKSEPPEQAKELYQQGIQFYQKKSYEEAISKWLQAVKLAPKNEFIYYNLGLAHYNLSNFGAAVAYFKKSIHLAPQSQPTRTALKLAQEKLTIGYGQASLFSWTGFKKRILSRMDIFSTAIACLLLLFLSGHLLIKYFSKKRKAFLYHLPSPAFPTVGIITSLILVLFIGVFAFKIGIYFQKKAVILENTQLLSAPDNQSNSLFDLLSGQEVEISQSQNKWLLVKHPGGFTGWVHQDSLIIINGDLHD